MIEEIRAQSDQTFEPTDGSRSRTDGDSPWG